VVARLSGEVMEDHNSYLRSTDDFPFSAVYSPIYEFPFRHTKLILDLEKESATAVLSALLGAATELEGTSATEVRNKLGHARPSFPSDDEIARACGGIDRALVALESEGLLPAVYVRVERSMDAFGRVRTLMRDGRRRVIELRGPSELDEAGMPRLTSPQLIPRGVRLASTSQALRLAYVEETKFTALLDAHRPLRSGVPGGETSTSEAQESTY
jgi:hypothetical protein